MKAIVVLCIIALSQFNLQAQYCPLLPFYKLPIMIVDSSGNHIHNLDVFIINRSKSALDSIYSNIPLKNLHPYMVEPGIWKATWHDTIEWQGIFETYPFWDRSNYIPRKRSVDLSKGYSVRFGLSKRGVMDSLQIQIPEQKQMGITYEEKTVVIPKTRYDNHLCPRQNLHKNKYYEKQIIYIELKEVGDK